MVDGSGRGRPRSESARVAVLHAVDDLLVEVGYAALTMKGIAERAGVGRQTVYRWWSNKAEVLYEASAIDARHELSVPGSDDPREGVKAYLDALVTFLSRSHAGAAYRALMGEAQHDADVAALLASRDILGESAAGVVEAARKSSGTTLSLEQATALLIGPPFFHILSGRSADAIDTEQLTEQFVRTLNHPGA
ncbi:MULTISPECIES: TetR/AcrR family transcriptional regulator [unclassified Streptomyces]|uniref:TetR/AcrR family transcriptional regulator n=1 Tax=unclassified Streptomyces TaxID=2593676 RepID=UPI002E79D657|nr:TetR/AcrR family transcriptional regulator [Streptomyces sp. JV190]MEE1844055.1 TetR/AcrR family transcriptional regulator [Streptomyces sp. JV190]